MNIENKIGEIFFLSADIGIRKTETEQKYITDLRFDYFVSLLDEKENMLNAERATNYLIKVYHG